MIFYGKGLTTHSFVRYYLLSKGVLTKTTAAVFPRGPKRGTPTMTTSTITARRKETLNIMLRENNFQNKNHFS